MRMNYRKALLAALFLALIFAPTRSAPPASDGGPCPGCQEVWKGNEISQSNNQIAVAGLRASIYEKAANWGITAGDSNELYQDNAQEGSLNGGIATSDERNFGLLVGSANEVHQLNDPMKADKFNIAANLQRKNAMVINETNEAIVLGDKNYAKQQNRETSKVSNLQGPDSVSEDNFALILGDHNKVRQVNKVKAANNGRGPIEVTEANAAYAYGYKSLIDQTNVDDAKVVARCTGQINQTSKNLAFAISSCCSPEFLPKCEGSALNGTCPTTPQVPPTAPEFPLDDWPLDP
jgi:hypothetical protein